MISFEFQSDLGKSLKKFPEELQKELARASKREAVNVESIAKKEHRFKPGRTGRLVKSIKGYGGAELSKVGRIFKKDSIETEVRVVLHDEGHPMGTEYGKYVHNGQRSWAPDPFIQNAIKSNMNRIYSAWEKAINKVAKGF